MCSAWLVQEFWKVALRRSAKARKPQRVAKHDCSAVEDLPGTALFGEGFTQRKRPRITAKSAAAAAAMAGSRDVRRTMSDADDREKSPGMLKTWLPLTGEGSEL